MDALQNVWQIISSEAIWLPGNLTWKEVDMMPNYPKGRDLYFSLVIAVLLLVFRILLNKFVYLPIGRALRVGGRVSHSEENSILNDAFKRNNMNHNQLQRLSREINWTAQKIEIWLRQKRNSVEKMKKFTESLWRLTFYLSIVTYGFWVVWGKSWITNVADCFPEISEEVVSDKIRWYYLTELGFYLSLCLSLFHDVRRKDFNIMLFHHAFTIILITVSWLVNATYIGCLVMLCHDVADIPLEASRIFKYLKSKYLTYAGLYTFLIMWCVGRLGYFPFLIAGSLLYSGIYLSTFCYYLLNGLLIALFSLHLLWTWMIIKVVQSTISGKQLSKMESDDEQSSLDDEDQKSK